MGFLINGVFGGIVLSMTESVNDAWGVSKRSGDDRDNAVYNDKGEWVSGGTKVDGVIWDPAVLDANGNITRPAGPDHGKAITHANPQLWYQTIGDRNGILENYIYYRTNVKFTQFSLNYNIPVRQLNLPLKSASVGLVGQNLFFLYLKSPYDPERTMAASRSVQAIDNFSTPSTRTLGFNIKVNF